MAMTKAPGWSDTCKVGEREKEREREREREHQIIAVTCVHAVEVFGKLGDNS